MVTARVPALCGPFILFADSVDGIDFPDVTGYTYNYMIPNNLRPLFWDIKLDGFIPTSNPDYTIARILEYGDEHAVAWMRKTFSEKKIVEVIHNERRLSRRSARFWALIYRIPDEAVAALDPDACRVQAG